MQKLIRRGEEESKIHPTQNDDGKEEKMSESQNPFNTTFTSCVSNIQQNYSPSEIDRSPLSINTTPNSFASCNSKLNTISSTSAITSNIQKNYPPSEIDRSPLSNNTTPNSFASCNSKVNTISSTSALSLNLNVSAPAPTLALDLRKNYTDRVNVAAINARSITRKTDDLVDIFNHANVNIALISESWEISKTGDKLEQMQELNDITWLVKRREIAAGGGAAIAISNSYGSIAKMDEINTRNIEIIWRIVTPHLKPHLKIVVGSFYSSTSSKYKPMPGEVQGHVIDVIDYCLAKYNNVLFVLGGDVNDSVMEDVTSLEAAFKQHVNQPTRGTLMVPLTAL